MTTFRTSRIDPRRLSMLPHQIARQHPGRREHLHGRIQDDLPTPRSTLTLACNVAVVAMFVLVAGLLVTRGWWGW